MAGSPRKGFSPNAQRALKLLASSPHGAPEELLVLGHGLKRQMLDGLVLAGFATVVTETMNAGAATIKVERYRITDDGRRVLEKLG
jgi:hypothetical protein